MKVGIIILLDQLLEISNSSFIWKKCNNFINLIWKLKNIEHFFGNSVYGRNTINYSKCVTPTYNLLT